MHSFTKILIYCLALNKIINLVLFVQGFGILLSLNPGKTAKSPECLLGREGAGGDDEEDVEDGRPDDGADAHVALGDEHADDGGEQLRGRPARRHEGGAGHVRADAELGGGRKKIDDVATSSSSYSMQGFPTTLETPARVLLIFFFRHPSLGSFTRRLENLCPCSFPPPSPVYYPTNNALLINFRIFVNKHRLRIQIGAKRAKKKPCIQRVHIPNKFPFCMPPSVVG